MTCGGDFGGGDSAFSGSNNSNKRQQTSSSTTKVKNSPDFYGTRCRSTCNIVVSAVADFLPTSEVDNGTFTSACNFIPEEEPDPFVFNTTASYTVQPEKVFLESAIF